MKNYNLIIVENKQVVPFFNLTEQDFYNKLWEWTYLDDLWDYLDDNPTILTEDLLTWIDLTVFHNDDEDDITCCAFVIDNEVKEYLIQDGLIEFVKSKIKEHYE